MRFVFNDIEVTHSSSVALPWYCWLVLGFVLIVFGFGLTWLRENPKDWHWIRLALAWLAVFVVGIPMVALSVSWFPDNRAILDAEAELVTLMASAGYHGLQIHNVMVFKDSARLNEVRLPYSGVQEKLDVQFALKEPHKGHISQCAGTWKVSRPEHRRRSKSTVRQQLSGVCTVTTLG